MTLKFAVPTRCFDLPLKAAISKANDSGATGVQFDLRSEIRAADFNATAKRQLRHYLSELGLQLGSFTFATRRPILAAEQIDARLAGIRNAMKFASEMQTRVLTVRIGTLPAQDSPDTLTLTNVLNDLARYGNHVGVTLAITPSGDAPENLKAVLDQVTEGPIGVDFDPAAFVIGGHSVIESYRILHRLVVHFRARDAVRGFDGNPHEVILGRGDVIWDELLITLQDASFAGWVTADRTTGDDKSGDLTRAIEYLTNVTAI